MITLSTDYNVLVREMRDEHPKAMYWLRRKFGSEKNYEVERVRLRYKAQESGHNERSEIFTFNSKNGNRWVMFIQAVRLKTCSEIQVQDVAFCIYETIGSVGTFVPSVDPSMPNGTMRGCIIFTSHFFLRASERMGFKYTSEDCLAKFIAFATSISVYIKPTDEGCKTAVDVRLPGAVGKGVVASVDPLVIEVRTCLSDSQLSRGQQRDMKILREFDGAMEYITHESLLKQSIKDPEGALTKTLERRETLKRLGTDMSMFDFLWCLHAIAVLYMMRHGMKIEDYYDRHYDFNDIFERSDREYIDLFTKAKSTDESVRYMCKYIRQCMKVLKYTGYDEKNCERFIRIDYGMSREVLDEFCRLPVKWQNGISRNQILPK